MKRLLMLGTTLAWFAAMASNASATVIGFVNNPANNSVTWNAAVTALGGSINTAVNFNAMTLGVPSGNFYSTSQGVTISQIGGINVASSAKNGGYAFPLNTGEGAWSSSKLLNASSFALSATPAQSVTFAFDQAVLGGGIFLVDYNGGTPWTISAKDANNIELGSFNSITGQSFQLNPSNSAGPYKYFLGIESTLNNIASITISRSAISMYVSGDIVGLDDFRFAKIAAATPVPEPLSIAVFGVGLLGLGLCRRWVDRRWAGTNKIPGFDG